MMSDDSTTPQSSDAEELTTTVRKIIYDIVGCSSTITNEKIEFMAKAIDKAVTETFEPHNTSWDTTVRVSAGVVYPCSGSDLHLRRESRALQRRSWS